MCGIIGYKGDRIANKVLLDGLKKLEYRGYDSVGMAIASKGTIYSKKEVGKVEDVEKKVNFSELKGGIGIGHTRWSTHGKVTKENAHPHLSNNNKIAVVHNGIIENYQELRNTLVKQGFEFKSETDTEIIPNLVESYIKTGDDVFQAFQKTLSQIRGSYAIVMMIAEDSKLYFARNGSPLVVGLGKSGNEVGMNWEYDGNEINLFQLTPFVEKLDQKEADRVRSRLQCSTEFFVASDIPPFLESTNQIIYLNDEEYGYYDDKLHVFDVKSGDEKIKKIEIINWTAEQAQKGKYPHFMLKEIEEQGESIRKAVEQPLEVIEKATKMISEAFGVFLVGCGTSYHACISAAYQFSHVNHKHMNVVLGSEFRNYEEFLTDKTVVIAVSQSGETADLLDAVKTAKKKNSKVIAIVNVMGSSLQRISDLSIMMQAGPEICVVSTKSYTSQLAILLLLAYSTAGKQEKGRELVFKAAECVKEIVKKNKDKIQELAERIKELGDCFLIGRDLAYPSALEGALKLKETAYIHAEGFAGGELKHGTIALIEERSPVIVLSTPQTEGLIVNNAEEIRSRGGYIIGVNSKKNPVYDYFIEIPDVGQANPLLMIIPIQLLAYYLAIKRECDPDKPRHLAKCVSVR